MTYEDIIKRSRNSKDVTDYPVTRVSINVPGCLAGVNKITVLPNGDILPCSLVRVPIGNILQETWDEIKKKKIYRENIESNLPLCFKYNLRLDN